MVKKHVQKHLATYPGHYLDGLNIDTIIDWCNDIKRKYGKEYHDIILRGDVEWSYEGAQRPSYEIFGERLETDQEYEIRIRKEKTEAARNNSARFNLYLQLKKEFEDV